MSRSIETLSRRVGRTLAAVRASGRQDSQRFAEHGLSLVSRSGFAKLTLAISLFFCVLPCFGQVPDSMEPPQVAEPRQLLLMEQAQELISAGEYIEAAKHLEKLFDQGRGRIVIEGNLQKAGTLATQRFVPLRDWAQYQRQSLVQVDPAFRAEYEARDSEAAEVAFRALEESKSATGVQLAAKRFHASSAGVKINLLWADICIERGWSVAALQAVQRAFPVLRCEVGEQGGTVPGWLVWAKLQSTEEKEAYFSLLEQKVESVREAGGRKLRLGEGLKRIVVLASQGSSVLDRETLISWASAVAENLLDESEQAEFRKLRSKSQAWVVPEPEPCWTTFAGDDSRNTIGSARLNPTQWPTWSKTLELYMASTDRTAASKPRMAESERGVLPYFPVVHNDIVFVNQMTKITAYDLKTGRAWPETIPATPLYDRQIQPSAFVPLNYPLIGVPRGTLAVTDNCLYARMGDDAVTGWANGEVGPDGGSLSCLVGLDLDRQGSQLRGFPLRLVPPEFKGFEFEGAPCIWGDWLLVAIVDRDNVGLRREVAAFDRFSGQLQWRSGTLATGTVEGSDQANLISHQLLTVAGGRIYCSTNLGSVVCLDPLTGETQWHVQYARATKRLQTYPSADRFRYRDLTPCLVSGGLVYCAPQDCPEIFALDATTGDLVWSSGLNLSDANQLLGVFEDRLIVSGDRITWLDRRSGKICARFPGSSTPGSTNALPSPRGLGRGVISDGRVYWPTAEEIFVFPAAIESGGVVPILERISIGSRGREGGNMVVSEGWLLYLTPNRLMAFEPRSNSDAQSASSQ